MNDRNHSNTDNIKKERNLNGTPVFFLLILIITMMLLHVFNVFPYIAGLTNSHTILLLSIRPFAIMGIMSLVAVGLLFWLTFGQWSKFSTVLKIKKLSIIIFSICVFLTGFLPYRPWRAMHTRGFRDHIKAKIDIQDIQTWLAKLEMSGQDYDYRKKLPSTEWPDCIRKLSPENVTIGTFLADRPTVLLSWGGGSTGMWGVVVSVPKPDVPLHLHDAGFYKLKLDENSYIWHG
jgi:hypothetical protein